MLNMEVTCIVQMLIAPHYQSFAPLGKHSTSTVTICTQNAALEVSCRLKRFLLKLITVMFLKSLSKFIRMNSNVIEKSPTERIQALTVIIVDWLNPGESESTVRGRIIFHSVDLMILAAKCRRNSRMKLSESDALFSHEKVSWIHFPGFSVPEICSGNIVPESHFCQN